MSIKFLFFLGGGDLGVWGGGGGWECRFYFYVRGEFSDLKGGTLSKGNDIRASPGMMVR